MTGDLHAIQRKLLDGAQACERKVNDAIEALAVFGDDRGVAHLRGQLELCAMLSRGLKRGYIAPVAERCESEVEILRRNLGDKNTQKTVLVEVHGDSLRKLLDEIKEGGR